MAFFQNFVLINLIVDLFILVLNHTSEIGFIGKYFTDFLGAPFPGGCLRFFAAPVMACLFLVQDRRDNAFGIERFGYADVGAAPAVSGKYPAYNRGGGFVCLETALNFRFIAIWGKASDIDTVPALGVERRLDFLADVL